MNYLEQRNSRFLTYFSSTCISVRFAVAFTCETNLHTAGHPPFWVGSIGFGKLSFSHCFWKLNNLLCSDIISVGNELTRILILQPGAI